MENGSVELKAMFCEKCGEKLKENALFCEKCGTKISDSSINDTTVLPKTQIISSQSNEDTMILPKQKSDKPKIAKEATFRNEKTMILPNKTIDTVSDLESRNIYSNAGVRDLSSDYYDSYKYVTAKKEKTVEEKKKQKKIIIIVSVIVFCLVVAVSGLLVWLNMPKTYDFNNYIDDYSLNLDTVEGDGEGIGFYYSGYDGYGIVNIGGQNVIDYEKLYKDIYNDNIKKKNRKNLDSNMRALLLSDNYSDAIDASGINNYITCSISKVSKLKNGDTVTVNIELDEEAFESMGIYFTASHYSISYKINDLKKGNVIDPFDYIKVVAMGANGNGDVEIKVDRKLDKDVFGLKVKWYDDSTISFVKDGNIISKVSFDFEEDYVMLSNGDTVTVNCNLDDFNNKVKAKYDIFTLNYTKEYTLSGLGEYATHSSKLTENDVAKFKENARSVLLGQESDIKKLEFASLHIGDKTEKNDFNADINKVILIYSYYDDFEEKTYYAGVIYEGVILDSKGNVYDSVEYYYNDFLFNCETEEDVLEHSCDYYGNSTYSDYIFN